MQHWEYLHLRVTVDSAGREKAASLNGQDIDEVTSSLLGMKVKAKGKDVHTFLNRVGKEGWERVACAPSGSASGYSAILKRPLA